MGDRSQYARKPITVASRLVDLANRGLHVRISALPVEGAIRVDCRHKDYRHETGGVVGSASSGFIDFSDGFYPDSILVGLINAAERAYDRGPTPTES